MLQPTILDETCLQRHRVNLRLSGTASDESATGYARIISRLPLLLTSESRQAVVRSYQDAHLPTTQLETRDRRS